MGAINVFGGRKRTRQYKDDRKRGTAPDSKNFWLPSRWEQSKVRSTEAERDRAILGERRKTSCIPEEQHNAHTHFISNLRLGRRDELFYAWGGLDEAELQSTGTKT